MHVHFCSYYICLCTYKRCRYTKPTQHANNMMEPACEGGERVKALIPADEIYGAFQNCLSNLVCIPPGKDAVVLLLHNSFNRHPFYIMPHRTTRHIQQTNEGSSERLHRTSAARGPSPRSTKGGWGRPGLIYLCIHMQRQRVSLNLPLPTSPCISLNLPESP